jgi:hypothetical protein
MLLLIDSVGAVLIRKRL